MDVGRTSQPLTATLRTPQGSAQRPSEAEGSQQQQAQASTNVAQARPPVAAAQPEPASPTVAAQQETPVEELQKMAEKLNAKLAETTQTQVRFRVDSQSGGVIVQVVDKESDEVVRQIPREEMIAFRQRMAEMRGILFDTEG